MLDTVIRGAVVIDGTGAPQRAADVGIAGGRIAVVGDVSDDATRTIDGSGLAVAPGFIDVHTHYDAQVFWDPTLSPSPLHGVTTVVAGNCGFSLAPLTGETKDYLLRLLSRVEGMPLQALHQGVPWDWSSTADYFARIRGTLSVNAGFLVGHSTLRRVVMGADATLRECTASELERMKELLRVGLEAGALGFSTSRGQAHQDGDGAPVPSRHASAEELVSLAAVCGEYPGTSLEMVPAGVIFDDAERSVMVGMSVAAQRPLNWNLMHGNVASAERNRANLRMADEARARGGDVIALAMPIDFAFRFCFLTPFLLDALPGWATSMALPPAERLRLLRTPDERQRLAQLAATTTKYVDLVDWGNKLIAETFSAETRQYEGRRVADIAAERGVSSFDALLDIVCADELRTTFSRIPAPMQPADWDAAAELWRDDRTMIGGSDAGAHLDLLATFNYPTYLLQHAVRETQVLTIEEATRMLTAEPARLYGLRDRGVVREGAVADLVVFSPETVAPGEIHTRFDLPGGAGRLYGEADGIAHVFVSGTEIVEHGSITDARPGSVLRSGIDTTHDHVGRIEPSRRLDGEIR